MENTEELSTTMDRLSAAAGRLEQLAERLAARSAEDEEATIGRIVAMVDQRREAESAGELERKLAAAEQRIAELEARASTVPDNANASAGRKTVPAAMTSLLAKHGVSLDSVEAGTLDAALTGLSLEQRIAVKAQLLRAGLLA